MISCFFALTFSAEALSCEALYSDDCDACITHFADRQCGFCPSLNKCMNLSESRKCGGDFYYGPASTCKAPAPLPPTAAPVPEPAQISNECHLYKSCDECTMHLSDRNCGWCATGPNSGKCVNGTDAKCEGSLYYNNNAKCGAPTPTPTPTPWAVNPTNASYCKAFNGKWCTACVATDPSMNCVWCHSTHECAMGDKDGFFFGTCPDYSYEDDKKCRGEIDNKSIIAIRACLAVFITIMTIGGIFICYKAIKQPKGEPNFEKIN